MRLQQRRGGARLVEAFAAAPAARPRDPCQAVTGAPGLTARSTHLRLSREKRQGRGSAALQGHSLPSQAAQAKEQPHSNAEMKSLC